MKNTLLLLAVILTLGVLLAAAQGPNTFCAANLPCTVSALWNYTGGLQSGGVSVLTNPVNLATQVTGTLAGSNMAAVNLAAGNVNGGVSGVLPGGNYAAVNLAGGNNPGGVTGTLPLANLAVQGTDTNLLSSGTVSASTGVALCTDALHGATTSGCTPGGVSESYIAFAGGGTSTAGIAEQTFLKTLTPNSHTLIRFTISALVQGNTCATVPVVALWDATAGSALTSLSIANNTAFFDSGAISVAITAGHQIDTKITTANSGCGTQPTLGNMVAVIQ